MQSLCLEKCISIRINPETNNLKIFAGKQLEKQIHNPLPEILGRLSGPDIITGLPYELALIIEFDLPAVLRLH
jgi:hypothetical protein